MTIKMCEEKLPHPILILIVIEHDTVQVRNLKRFFVEVSGNGNVSVITNHAERPALLDRKAVRSIIAILNPLATLRLMKSRPNPDVLFSKSRFIQDDMP
jgi:hypothetical protein